MDSPKTKVRLSPPEVQEYITWLEGETLALQKERDGAIKDAASAWRQLERGGQEAEAEIASLRALCEVEFIRVVDEKAVIALNGKKVAMLPGDRLGYIWPDGFLESLPPPPEDQG